MKQVITISRQYASGGRTIGKMVADKLGIPFNQFTMSLLFCVILFYIIFLPLFLPLSEFVNTGGTI